MKKVVVIGSGFAGISAAACLAAEGFDVTVVEKNATPGGRARQFESNGFIFDMGPSWYWMPDVIANFFQRFGKKVPEYYELKRLDPSYRIYYNPADYIDVPAGVPALRDLFEKIEKGSSKPLMSFLEESEFKYTASMGDLVYNPGQSWRELARLKLLSTAWRFNLFQSHSKYVRNFFKHPRLTGLLEFPILFLGAAPDVIPALYSLMNYADMVLGTWYPLGGMHKIVEGMIKVAQENGAKFLYNTPATRIEVNGDLSTGVWTGDKFIAADYIVSGADYRHVEKKLLPEASRQYSDEYWDKRMLAPSCLIFYLGIKKRIKNLLHHTLFFDESIDRHLQEIYDNPRWPRAPQFYVCCPSKTDSTVAPPECENVFILIPVAPDLNDSESIREKYFSMAIHRIEKMTGETILPHIVYKKSYAHSDFKSDYNAFKGNAYGLANTLLQTANLKPAIASSKVNNLFFAGQFTVPGPGIPPCIISGQVVAEALIKSSGKKTTHKHFDARFVK